MEKTRREKADEFCELIDSYLTDAGWGNDDWNLMRIDPITGNRHYAVIAIHIQLDRDIVSKKANI